MKILNTLYFLLLLTGVSYSQKQKVTLEDDTIQVDGKNYAIIEKKSGMSFDFTIKTLDGKEQIYFQFLEYNNPNKINSGNPKGRITYYEVTFFGTGQKCEVQSPGTKKGVAKLVVENNLITANEVNAESEKKLILIHGMKYSKEKETLNGPSVIIIKD